MASIIWLSLLGFMVGVVEPPAEELRSIGDYAQVQGGGVNLIVPEQPLTELDVFEWARILGASEPQSQFMTTMYGRFVEQHNAYLDREAPRYLEHSVEFGQAWAEHGHSSPELLRVMRRMNQASKRLRRELTAIEHEFILLLEPILSDEQRDRVPIIQHEATRRNCRTFHSSARWTEIELRDIWNEVSNLATVQEQREVEALLADYEVRLTSLVCDRADLAFEVQEQLAENRIAMAEGAISAERGAARYHHLRRRLVDSERSIRRLTEDTVAQFEQLLSRDASTQFRAKAKGAAFPELYPDTNRLHELFASVLTDQSVPHEKQEKVTSLSAQYAASYSRICNELEEFCIEWGDRTAEGLRGYRRQFLSEALRPLLEDRTVLREEYLILLVEVIGEEAVARNRAASNAHDAHAPAGAGHEAP